MFLTKETPTTKLIDDDEWIRPLTEAQTGTSDFPEDRVTHDLGEVDLKKKGSTRPVR